jgi:hypothetical protein
VRNLLGNHYITDHHEPLSHSRLRGLDKISFSSKLIITPIQTGNKLMNCWQKMDVQTDRINSRWGFLVYLIVMALGAYLIH